MTVPWKPDLQKNDTPLYLAIVRTLEEDIGSGKLQPESRLPTHRELADSLGVAIGTVTHAYLEAEQRGLVHGRGRRGTFVGRSPAKDGGLSVLLEAGSRVVDFSKNYPLYSEDPDLAAAIRQLGRKMDVQKFLQYPPPAGLPHHRVAGSRWIDRMGMKVDPASVIVTSGAQHGLMVVFSAIARRGDVVLTDEYTYPGIKAVAEISTFRFRAPSLVVLGTVIASALVAIGLLAGVVKDLVVDHRWIMYSLFIGLTLGGVPVVWKLARPPSRGLWWGVVAGFVAMAALALAQTSGVGQGSGDAGSFVMLMIAGVAGASAMILPGVSGGYLLTGVVGVL